MKVAHLLHGNAWGGMEKFCVELCNHLLKEGHEVLLIADPAFKSDCDPRIVFETLNIELSRNNPFLLYSIYKKIKSFHPNIVQVHKQNSLQIIKRLAPFLKIPYIVTKHDMQHKKAFLGLRYGVTISDEVSRTIEAEKLFKIYNGVSRQSVKKIAMPEGFNIVAVGGLRKVKGFDRLIEAVSQLSFPVHLTILGEGSERSALEEKISKLGLKKSVTLAGFCKNVQDYLYSADLQVISSYSEGFSLAMVEGIFYAPVLISTKVSGATEILSEDLLYDIDGLAEKITDVHTRNGEYQRSFQKVKEKCAEALTIEACAQKYVQVYEEVVKDFHGT